MSLELLRSSVRSTAPKADMNGPILQMLGGTIKLSHCAINALADRCKIFLPQRTHFTQASPIGQHRCPSDDPVCVRLQADRAVKRTAPDAPLLAKPFRGDALHKAVPATITPLGFYRTDPCICGQSIEQRPLRCGGPFAPRQLKGQSYFAATFERNESTRPLIRASRIPRSRSLNICASEYLFSFR